MPDRPNFMRNELRQNKLLNIGIELEADNVTARNFNNQYFHIDHDASIESDKFVNDGDIPVYFDKAKNGDKSKIGVEFVSRILDGEDTDNLWKIICDLLEYLNGSGETSESERAGIHYHIGVGGMNFSFLRNSLSIVPHLEQVFYYLGGMGYRFRGESNGFNYCRPITKYGPPVFRNSGKYCQVFTLDDLKSAKTYTEFFNKYGGIDPMSPPGKYFPVRYNWFTWYPILTKGTVEFRVFNKTMNPQYIFATLMFSRFVVQQFFTRSYEELPMNSIYDPADKSKIIDTMLNFIRGELSPTVIDSLIHIINRTPEMECPKGYYLSHLDGKYEVDTGKFYPKAIPYNEEVKKPKIVDIHVLRGERN